MRTSLHVPRDDFVSAVVGDEIWVMGGMSGSRGTRLDSVEVYDTSADRWRMSDVTMPEGLASFEGAAIGEKIYVFGGLNAQSKASDFSGGARHLHGQMAQAAAAADGPLRAHGHPPRRTCLRHRR